MNSHGRTLRFSVVVNSVNEILNECPTVLRDRKPAMMRCLYAEGDALKAFLESGARYAGVSKTRSRKVLVWTESCSINRASNQIRAFSFGSKHRRTSVARKKSCLPFLQLCGSHRHSHLRCTSANITEKQSYGVLHPIPPFSLIRPPVWVCTDQWR